MNHYRSVPVSRCSGGLLFPVLLFFAVLSSSCFSPIVSLEQGNRSYRPSDYNQVLEKWTRSFQILPVDGIENVLTATVTHLSWDYRFAYTVKVTSDLRLSPNEREKLKNDTFSPVSKGYEFFVTTMSGLKNSDILTGEDSPWTIRLVDNKGRFAAPLRIEEIRKPSAADIKYFGFDPVHRKAFRIFFPLNATDGKPLLDDDTRYYMLQFSSPHGQGEARWNTAAD